MWLSWADRLLIFALQGPHLNFDYLCTSKIALYTVFSVRWNTLKGPFSYWLRSRCAKFHVVFSQLTDVPAHNVPHKEEWMIFFLNGGCDHLFFILGHQVICMPVKKYMSKMERRYRNLHIWIGFIRHFQKNNTIFWLFRLILSIGYDPTLPRHSWYIYLVTIKSTFSFTDNPISS